MREAKEKERLAPEIERLKRLIDLTKLDIHNNENWINKEMEKTKDLNEQIEELDKKKEVTREEQEKQNSAYLKIKDEPIRIGKGNENLRIAVNHLKSELESLKRDEETVDNLIKIEAENKEKYLD